MKKEILKFLVLAMLAVGAGPVSAAVWQWSRTATSNATADSSINWAEGMSPSSVNDSARSMMARIADYRDDVGGLVNTAGTSTAYTWTSRQVFDTTAHMDGARIAFIAHATNGASPTLAVDGLAARALVSATGVAIPAGTLIAGSPYSATYTDSTSEWRLHSIYGSAYSIPLGGLMAYTGTSAPNSNFILPAGQCISTTTYAAYWALRGSPVPGACAAGQFAVVDLRGRTLAAMDDLNGTPASRMTSLATGCGVAFTSVGTVCGGESQTLTVAQLPAHSHSGTTGGASNDHTHSYSGPSGSSTTGGGGFSISAAPTTLNTGGVSADHTHNFNTGNTGSGTAHPNVQPTIAVTYLLRVI